MNKQEAAEKAYYEWIDTPGMLVSREEVFAAGRASLEPLVQALVTALATMDIEEHERLGGMDPADCPITPLLAAAREQGFLTDRMGFNPRSVDLLLQGYSVDEPTARALGRAFGTSWEVWLGLQMIWDGSLLHTLGEAGKP